MHKIRYNFQNLTSSLSPLLSWPFLQRVKKTFFTGRYDQPQNSHISVNPYSLTMRVFSSLVSSFVTCTVAAVETVNLQVKMWHIWK